MRGLAERQQLSVAAVRRGRRREVVVPDAVLDAAVAADRLVAAVLAHRLWAAAALVPAERPVTPGQRLADSQS
jgi:acetyl-CoA acetyltransferase